MRQDELEHLRGRLRSLAADSDTEPQRRAALLATFEQDLIAYTADVAAEDPTFAKRRGLPALAWAADWRDQIREQEVEAAVGPANRLVERLVEDDAWGWQRRAQEAQDEGADACFRCLREATLLDAEAVARRQDGHADAPPLGGHRDAVRTAFLAAIEAEAPGERVRGTWATQLADAADVVLTAVDDVEPHVAAVQIDLIADEIDWFLEHVESPERPTRRLRRKRRRLRRERQERELQGRLEDRFGKTRVRRFDKLIVWLIFLVLAILAVEVMCSEVVGVDESGNDIIQSSLSDEVHIGLAIVDTLACFVFLLEFFVKLKMVEGRTSWFLRHFLIDLVPSVPVGLIAVLVHVLHAGEALKAAELARVLRAWRLARIVRLTRYARAIGFLARGFDRMGRRYSHLLNHDIVLFPTREERRAAEQEAESLSTRVWRLRSSLNGEWRELLHAAPVLLRDEIARTRIDGIEAARARGLTRSVRHADAPVVASTREIPAEQMLRKLDAVSPAQLEADLGSDFVARIARAVRAFARPGVRWLPVLRRYVPRVGPHMSAAEVTAAASHAAAKELRRHHDRWFWFADLHGTVTPSEFVDRVGTTMVRSSFRPAYRLALFGLGYLVVIAIIKLFGANHLEWLQRIIEDFLGPVIIVLGGVCIFVLGIGWWLKRLAGQATAFYEQTVHAQFLALTEAIKGRYIDRDAALFDARVFRAEVLAHGHERGDGDGRRTAFAEAVRRWLIQARAGLDLGELTPTLERAILLYRDGLDGALFTESDARTTSQLIGNPALRQMRGLSRRVDRKESAALMALDLSVPRSAIRGPYLWFSFISKAIAQATARLVVEYNRYAIPLDELAYATERERLRYTSWIERGRPPDGEIERLHLQKRGYITTAFTALHFLDDDEGRDAEVEDRFGPEVLQNLQRDRRRLFRDVFGTYPLHAHAKDQRVLNLYRVYDRWFGGGRAFIIPLRVFWRWLKMLGRLLRWLVNAIGEIRTPRTRGEIARAIESDFHTARRKIGRMRDPIVWACIWLRARFDAEYLGVRVPGTAETGLEGATWEEDLRFLDATGRQWRKLAAEQARAEADTRRLARLLDDGELRAQLAAQIGIDPSALTREHLRAATVAYRGDFRSVRSLLSCGGILRETLAGVLDSAPLPFAWWPRPRLWFAFRRWWRVHGRDDRPSRKGMWRAVVHDVDGVRPALLAWDHHGEGPAYAEGVRRLADLLRNPGRISEQVVTLRIVQTLALIDLRTYREHVYRLGAYAADGDAQGPALAGDACAPHATEDGGMSHRG